MRFLAYRQASGYCRQNNNHFIYELSGILLKMRGITTLSLLWRTYSEEQKSMDPLIITSSHVPFPPLT